MSAASDPSKAHCVALELWLESYRVFAGAQTLDARDSAREQLVDRMAAADDALRFSRHDVAAQNAEGVLEHGLARVFVTIEARDAQHVAAKRAGADQTSKVIGSPGAPESALDALAETIEDALEHLEAETPRD